MVNIFETGIPQGLTEFRREFFRVNIFEAGIPQRCTPQEHISSKKGCVDFKWNRPFYIHFTH